MLFSNAKNALLALAVCATVAATANAQNAPKSLTKGATVEGITEYSMPNGLKVLLFPDQSAPKITVNITFLVGSRSEGYGETGMAHLLEHMVFKGTPRHTNIAKELGDHGCNFNGTTWLDRTNYYETFPASDENLEWALDMESDRMVNSNIAKKDLVSEMTVVRNEFEGGENNPTSILMERVFSSAYLWHNYGKSTIGNRSDIENVPIENLQAFYRKYYQPDNAVLLVAGKIDEAKVLSLIDKYFGKIEKPTRVLPVSYTTEPTQDGERSVTLRRVGDVQIVSAAYHIAPLSHPDYPIMDVLTSALSDEPSGRIYKALVESKKATQQWAWALGAKEPGLVYFNVEMPQTANLEEARKILLNTLDSVSFIAFKADEIERAKTKLLKQTEQLLRNSEQLGVAMTDFIASGDWRLIFLYRDALKKVTPEQVARVAKSVFKSSNRTVGMFVPDKAPERTEIPQAPDVAAMVGDYKGDAAVAEGEVFDPSTDNIDKRTKRGTESTTGYKFAFLNKKTRGNTVNASLTIRFGDEKTLMNQAINARMVAALLERGTKNKTRQQINDAFDNLKATVNFRNGGDKLSVNVETKRENLPAVLSLITEILRDPILPEKDFEEVRQAAITGIEQGRNEPSAIVQKELRRTMMPLPKGHISYVPTFDEEIADVKGATLADAKKFHSTFYGAGDATIAIVGDFDEAAAQKALTEGFKGFKSKMPYKRAINKHVEIAPSNKEVKTPDKANAIFGVGQNIKLRDDDPNYAAMTMANYIFGGGFLSSRLMDRIRQKDGLSYGVYSMLQVNPVDDAGMLAVWAMHAPENVEKVEKAFREEVERLVKEGVSQKELDDARKGFLQNNIVERTNDGGLAGDLSSKLYLNRTMAFEGTMDKKIENLTVEQINQAIKTYITLNKMTFIKAGDFGKVKKP